MNIFYFSMQPATARNNFSEALESFKKIISTMPQRSTTNSASTIPSIDPDETYRKLSDRVFYVRGASPAKKICWGVRFVIFFCKSPLDPTRPNDGLLHVEDQLLEGFGTDLGILEYDHIDLVIGTVQCNAVRCCMQWCPCQMIVTTLHPTLPPSPLLNRTSPSLPTSPLPALFPCLHFSPACIFRAHLQLIV